MTIYRHNAVEMGFPYFVGLLGTLVSNHFLDPLEIVDAIDYKGVVFLSLLFIVREHFHMTSSGKLPEEAL